jgi:hypothetical protein
MAESAERRWEAHTCGACQTHFEVGYNEPPEGVAWGAAEIACPQCGKRKTVSLPKGAEKDLKVQRQDEEVDEGAGD